MYLEMFSLKSLLWFEFLPIKETSQRQMKEGTKYISSTKELSYFLIFLQLWDTFRIPYNALI